MVRRDLVHGTHAEFQGEGEETGVGGEARIYVLFSNARKRGVRRLWTSFVKGPRTEEQCQASVGSRWLRRQEKK